MRLIAVGEIGVGPGENRPGENLGLDEELLARGEACLRFWETASECVVVGRSGRPEQETRLPECLRAGVPVLRRCSGGGAVLLGPGCLNYSIVLPLASFPELRNVAYSMEWILERMRRALGLPGLRHEGISDLALSGRKVSGNAQRRTQHAILHHGTLLYGFDAARAEMFLRPPVREPAYRAGRTHSQFLSNLPLTADEIRQRVLAHWC